jgi:hypothetical protein
VAVDAEPGAVLAAARAAADQLLGRADGELHARCDELRRAYAAADEALAGYESLAATGVVRKAYQKVLRSGWARKRLRHVETTIVDRRIEVTRTMSAHVTAWFQLHSALTEVRAQAMHLIEVATESLAEPLPPVSLQDGQLDEAEQVARRHGPEELRERLKRADGSIKHQIRGSDQDTQPLGPDD